jgi:hypothetical protein
VNTEDSRDLGMVSEPGPEVDAESLGKNSEKDRELQAVESSNEVERTVYGTFRVVPVCRN